MFQVDLGTAPFHVRPDGEPGIDLVALDIARNARFAGKDGIVANGDVASAAGLTGKDDVIAGFGAASDARLGDEETVFTDFDVVAEMDEVVDFRPPADFRRTQGCIIETVQAPISTSSPRVTLPICGIRVCLPFSVAKPKPSPPMTA